MDSLMHFLFSYMILEGFIKASVQSWLPKIGIKLFYYIIKFDGKNSIFFSVFKWERIFVHKDIWKLS